MLHNPRMAAWMGQSWGHLSRWPNNALATSSIPTRKRALVSEFVAVCYIWPSTICVLHSGLCMYVYIDPFTAAGCVRTSTRIHTQQRVVYVRLHGSIYSSVLCMYIYIDPYTALCCVRTSTRIRIQQRVVYVRVHGSIHSSGLCCVCTCTLIHTQQRVVYVHLHTHDPIYNALLPDAP